MAERVLVTGIAGHIGRRLGKFLRSEGYRVAGLDLRTPPEDACDEFVRCDLLDADALGRALARFSPFDHVAHLAAVVAPTEAPGAMVFATNVIGTYNLLMAAPLKRNGRLICMSSESVLGFAFAKRPLKPAFAPVDETHPLRAHDAYGLSKLLAEQVCRAYHHETEATAICLRPPWVWIPEEAEQCRALTEDPGKWAHSLWAYVVVDDLCAAVRDAMAAPLPAGFFAFFTAAAENGTRLPSRVLLETHYGFTGPYRGGFGEYDSVISSAAARAALRWRPKWNWRDWLAALAPQPPGGIKA